MTGSVSNGKPSKAALIVPQPTIAMRSTPNSVYRISTALCRSICFSPQTIHEICRESRYARYSFVTSVDIMTINGESPLLSSCHNQFFRPQTSSCGRLYMVFSCISSSITSFSYLWCSRAAVFVHPPYGQYRNWKCR